MQNSTITSIEQSHPKSSFPTHCFHINFDNRLPNFDLLASVKILKSP